LKQQTLTEANQQQHPCGCPPGHSWLDAKFRKVRRGADSSKTKSVVCLSSDTGKCFFMADLQIRWHFWGMVDLIARLSKAYMHQIRVCSHVDNQGLGAKFWMIQG
jgi:hypothetical protein